MSSDAPSAPESPSHEAATSLTPHEQGFLFAISKGMGLATKALENSQKALMRAGASPYQLTNVNNNNNAVPRHSKSPNTSDGVDGVRQEATVEGTSNMGAASDKEAGNNNNINILQSKYHDCDEAKFEVKRCIHTVSQEGRTRYERLMKESLEARQRTSGNNNNNNNKDLSSLGENATLPITPTIMTNFHECDDVVEAYHKCTREVTVGFLDQHSAVFKALSENPRSGGV
eukprot:Tbor_TRINITY_DN5767_c5_g4::TRINITY_DN5767_c5_g4_i1::g.20678::m.20678